MFFLIQNTGYVTFAGGFNMKNIDKVEQTNGVCPYCNEKTYTDKELREIPTPLQLACRSCGKTFILEDNKTFYTSKLVRNCIFCTNETCEKAGVKEELTYCDNYYIYKPVKVPTKFDRVLTVIHVIVFSPIVVPMLLIVSIGGLLMKLKEKVLK